jgi:hypothetical protein
MDYTPIILKNKGVPVEFAVVEKQPEGTYKRKFNEEGEPEIEKVFVRFTHNTIADIEDKYITLDLWQNGMETRPTSTVRDTFALAMNKDPYEIGEAMLEGRIFEYSNAISASWGIANGVDPIVASRLLRQGNDLARNQLDEQNKAITENLDLQDSPGKSGSPSGTKRAVASKSSGN